MRDKNIKNKDISFVKNKISVETEKVEFLGRLVSIDEYEEACRNLEDYFNLLKSWQQGESDES